MISKSVLLEKQLLQDIILGKYPVGDAIPSRNRLAARYHCSRTTVERAVSSLAKAGYLNSTKGSGTYVRTTAPEHGIKELWVVAGGGAFSNPEMIFTEESMNLPIRWMKSADAAAHMDQLAQPGNAILWMLPGEEQIFIMDYLQNRNIPQLLYNREYRQYNHVITDPVASIREGLAWLMIEAGREIAFISEMPQTERPYQHRRIIAFYELCVELGAKLRPNAIFSRNFNDIPAEVAEISARLFSSPEHPRGIFVMNSELALPLITCAQGYGLKAGRDYFLLVFDMVPELTGYCGVGMMRQPYRVQYQEFQRWIRGGFAERGENFKIAQKTDLVIGSDDKK